MEEQEKIITYELMRDNPPPWYRMQSSDSQAKRLTVKDNGRIRAIRYCTNQDSIFVDEQNSEFAQTGSIVFENGILSAPASETPLHKFMKVNPGNELNGGRVFRVVDFAAMSKAQLKFYEDKDRAAEMLKQASVSMKKNMLRELNPKVYTEAKIVRMSDAEVTLESRVLAESMPYEVIDFFGAEDTGDDILPIAIERGFIIEKIKQGGWREISKNYDNEAVIMKIKKEDNLLKKLREHFATSPDGAEQLKILEALVDEAY